MVGGAGCWLLGVGWWVLGVGCWGLVAWVLGWACHAAPFRRPGAMTEKGAKHFRSRERFLGFPNFTGRDKLRVDLANALTDFMYDLFLQCRKTGTPVYIESPRSSLLWAMPQMQLLSTIPGVQKVRYDYWQFGTACRKPMII